MVPSGMERRTAIVVAVVLLLGAVAAIQLADPRFGERTPPEVNFSEPPEEVAADAATQFKYVDYAYRIDFRRNRTDDWRQVRTMRVDHSDREYYKTGPMGQDGVVIYGTDAVTFVRPGSDNSWRITAIQEALYPALPITQPFRPESIRDSNAESIFENSSIKRIKVFTHPVKIAQYSSGTAILSIQKDSGLIECAYISYTPGQTRPIYLHFHLTSVEVNVNRPSKIGPSIQELFWDVVRGPLLHPI